MEIPLASVDLIALLDKTYPLKNVSPDLTERQIFYRAGQRSVIDMLKFALEDTPAIPPAGRS